MNNIEKGYVNLFTRYSQEATAGSNKGNLEQQVLDTADAVLGKVDGVIADEINSLSNNSNTQSNQQSLGVGLARTLTKPGIPAGNGYEDYQSPAPMTYGGANMETNQYRENAFINIVTLLAIIALIAVVAMVCVMIFPIVK